MDATNPAQRIIRAQEGPQRQFLATSADIAIYGGSAGGGKTWALLLEPLRHLRTPGFGAVFFRRSYPEITNQGGLWDESSRLYPIAGLTPKAGPLEWHSSYGSRISFRHLQHEETKYDWQGSQVPLFCFDELTHFTESTFFYLLSRNRSTCGVQPYVRATTNPDAGSWVKKFLAPWIDRTYPDPARSGEIRWFVRINGVIHWARTPEEIKQRFGDQELPKSCTFIRASVYDNRVLLEKDPGYLANLRALPPVERARLLDGDWDVRNEGLVYPDFGSCVVEPEAWPKQLPDETVGGIDWGWNNPFAALLATLDRDDVLWVSWERYGSRITLGEHAAALPKGVRWYADPAGADQIGELRRRGHDVVPAVHLGHQPLQHGIDLVTQRIRTGRLKVKGTCGNLITEAGIYRYDKETEKPEDRDNHALAALRYLIVSLDRNRAQPPAAERAMQVNQDALEATAADLSAEADHYDLFNDRWFQ